MHLQESSAKSDSIPSVHAMKIHAMDNCLLPTHHNTILQAPVPLHNYNLACRQAHVLQDAIDEHSRSKSLEI